MKKQKIVITGSLGYIGSALTELLSGEVRYKDIVCIDNRFMSSRVTQLRQWGMTFIQGSILDKELMQKHLHDADIVYHLAGITDVAYTATQSNAVQDELIRSVGIQGTWNIIMSLIGTRCKLVFPSSHVVFEGLQSTEFALTENSSEEPVLTYAKGKLQSENDIQDEIENHIIVRLGSVYGYSGDTMRINIMPNLFSKIASQDGTISMFGGGVQYKSLVNITDVVRAMKYLAEGEYTGTYHLSNENMTVADVANICKKVNPKVTLQSTDDEIPNKGYTLSNAKLLSTGFKFLYNIEDSIREMINKWSYRDTATADEYIDKGGNEYIDDRGIIRNYELTEPINLIGYIESKQGTVRANHYHPIQEQKCLLISGRYISVTKDLSYPDAPVEYKVISPEDIAIIRPNVAHTMVFIQDSIFLNLVRGERDHDNYGITHTIPYILVDEEHRKRILAIDITTLYKSSCRVCSNRDLVRKVVDLGMSPLANNLLDSPDQHCDMYPLELDYCPHCYNVQLSVVVPASKMFDNYLYVSSTSQVFRQHFENAATKYIQEFRLGPDSIVWDIGSNDGVFLKPLQAQGIQVCGIEPAANLAQLANEQGIHTIHGYFDQDTAHSAYEQVGSPDIVTASNVFAHADDLVGITQVVFANLRPGGVFIIEVQYLMDTIRDMTFDNIYHEHVNYWSVTALYHFFNRLGYTMFHVEHIDTHGGSIRCYISNGDAPYHDGTIQHYLDRELYSGINRASTFRDFGNRIAIIRKQVQANMKLLRAKYPLIAGYGSPAKATTALNYFGITGDVVECTIDDNTLKQYKYIPGVNIPILSLQYPNPDLYIVLAWNFYDSIVKKLPPGIPCISIKDLEKRSSDLLVLDTYTTELQGIQSTGKVYDCFLFFNELDLLEMRLSILDSVVDYFVICEANITHSGVPREYCFAANRDRFSRWAARIIYIQVNDMPADFNNIHIYGEQADYESCHLGWNVIAYRLRDAKHIDKSAPLQCREYWQRESIIRALQNCQPDDVIMLSDIDEIPNPQTVSGILQQFDSSRVYGLRQSSYYYKLNLLKETHWVGPRISSYSRFTQQPVGTFRHIRDIIVAHGGWHFSFQTASGVAEKLTAYSHSDMADESVMANLGSRIQQGIDPFNRGSLTQVPIDGTYPQYLLDNIDHYKHMIA